MSKRNGWQLIAKEIPEIVPRLRELVKNNQNSSPLALAKILNEEFKANLAKLGKKIQAQQIKKIIEPNGEQLATPGGGESPIKDLSAQEKNILRLLKKSRQTVAALSEHIGVPKESLFPIIDELRLKGFDIIKERNEIVLRREPVVNQMVILPPITKKFFKFLVLSDLCLGLKDQQGDLVATAYKIAEEEEVFFALIAGNVVAGKPSKAKSNEYFLFDARTQADYVIAMLPRASFKTYFINGPRELTFSGDGINIGTMIAKERDDVSYCGDEKATFELGKKGVAIAIAHIGENVAYTKSYPLQGITENFQEAVRYAFEHSGALQAVFVGGTRSYINIPRRLPIVIDRYNDFDGIAVPSLYRATPSQKARKKKGMSPVLGCVIVTIAFDKKDNPTEIIYDFRDLSAYHRDDDFLEELVLQNNLTDEEKTILDYLKKRPRRKGEISRLIQQSSGYVEKKINGLCKRGYMIEFDPAQKSYCLHRNQKSAFNPIDIKSLNKKSVKIAAISDTHLGCKHSRPDLLPQAYAIAEKEKVDVITHSGDIFEGESAYRGQTRDLTHHGADAQRNYGLEIWPKSKIPTIFVRGTSHELAYWLSCGHDIVDTFVKMAPSNKLYNLHYLGDHRGVIDIKNVKVELVHPKGGIPYGISYKPQKRIERLVSVLSPSDAKVSLCGHLHVSVCMAYKGMVAFLVPCMEDQTGYLSEKDLIPYLGMWIMQISLDQYDNITRVATKYIPFEPKSNIKTIKL